MIVDSKIINIYFVLIFFALVTGQQASATDCLYLLMASQKVEAFNINPSQHDPYFREILKTEDVRIAYSYHPDGSPFYFEIVDLKEGRPFNAGEFKIEAKLENGILSFHIRTKSEKGKRSQILKGKELFDRMMAHFDGHIKAIRLQWDYGDNLKVVNRLYKQGHPLIEAAQKTWSAQQVARYGFKKIEILESTQVSSEFSFVVALIKK